LYDALFAPTTPSRGRFILGKRKPSRRTSTYTTTGSVAEDAIPEPNRRYHHDLFRSLLDDLDIGVADATQDGVILYANSRFVKILGRVVDENLAGVNLRSFVAIRDWDELATALREGAEHPLQGEMKVVEAESGALRTIRLSFSHLESGKSSTVKIVATEVTEQLATAQALKESESSLQSLSARLLQVQDEERRRMARDLHDITGQELAIVIMSLDRLQKAPNEEIHGSLAEIAGQVRKVESEIRTLSYVLHPPLLDEMGLRSALYWYIEGFSKRTNVHVEAEMPSDLPRLGLDMETALFRVIQESLTNVVRHSGSRKARVNLSVDFHSLNISIEDEGKGFDQRKTAGGRKSGVGVQSMNDRIKLLGGKLEIRSGEGGTRVLASVPLPRGEDDAASEESKQPNEIDANRSAPASAAKNGPRRILIADDHVVARQGIKFLLGDQSDLEICGEAEDGLQAVAKALELKPDLLILDLSMPHLGGFSVAHEIRKAGVPVKILMYTTHSYPGLERVARAAGCNGFVLKSDATTDLIRGVRAVLQNVEFYGSETARAHSV
jgi:PAS domain S-box-containing protein